MNDIQKLRYWTFKILPLVYDDSLSYYEVLAKVTAKTNELVENVNEIPDAITAGIKEALDSDTLATTLFNNFAKAIATDEGEATYTANAKNGGELIWLNGTLYEAVVPMAAGTNYIVGTNLNEVVLSDYLNHMKGYLSDNNEFYAERSSHDYDTGVYLYWKDNLYITTADIKVNDILYDGGDTQNVKEVTLGEEISSHYLEMHNADNNLQTQIDGNDGDIEKLQNKDIDLQNQVNTNNAHVNSRIDNLVANTGDSNSEIVDARVGATVLGGKTYTSLGEAIRDQIELSTLNNLWVPSGDTEYDLDTLPANTYVMLNKDGDNLINAPTNLNSGASTILTLGHYTVTGAGPGTVQLLIHTNSATPQMFIRFGQYSSEGNYFHDWLELSDTLYNQHINVIDTATASEPTGLNTMYVLTKANGTTWPSWLPQDANSSNSLIYCRLGNYQNADEFTRFVIGSSYNSYIRTNTLNSNKWANLSILGNVPMHGNYALYNYGDITADNPLDLNDLPTNVITMLNTKSNVSNMPDSNGIVISMSGRETSGEHGLQGQIFFGGRSHKFYTRNAWGSESPMSEWYDYQGKDTELQTQITALQNYTGQSSIVVNVSDYDNLLECFRAVASMDENATKLIEIPAGTYNLNEMYGGDSYFEGLDATDLDWRDVNPAMHNVKIEGKGNVIINLTLPTTVSGAVKFLFSPLNLVGNYSIKNLHIIGNHCRYALHSERTRSAYDNDQIQTLDNIWLTGQNGTGQIMGCGTANYYRMTMNNVRIESDNASTELWSCHSGGQPIFTFNNCQFVSTGTSAVHIRMSDSGVMNLNNCIIQNANGDAGGIRLRAESNVNTGKCNMIINAINSRIGTIDNRYTGGNTFDSYSYNTLTGEVTKLIAKTEE